MLSTSVPASVPVTVAATETETAAATVAPSQVTSSSPEPPTDTDTEQWRRWELKTSDFPANQATTGNHGKPDPELPETKDDKKHVQENALPTGKIERESTEGRADVGDVPTAETLGSLARKVLSTSRHAESRELARAVLRLLARRRGRRGCFSQRDQIEWSASDRRANQPSASPRGSPARR